MGVCGYICITIFCPSPLPIPFSIQCSFLHIHFHIYLHVQFLWQPQACHHVFCVNIMSYHPVSTNAILIFNLQATKSGGTLVVVGMGKPVVQFPIVDALVREVDIRGIFRYTNWFVKKKRDLNDTFLSLSLPSLKVLFTHPLFQTEPSCYAHPTPPFHWSLLVFPSYPPLVLFVSICLPSLQLPLPFPFRFSSSIFTTNFFSLFVPLHTMSFGYNTPPINSL